MEEEWKDIRFVKGIDFSERYQISNFGRFKSLNYRNTGKTKILKLSVDNTGYFNVVLQKNKKRKNYSIHRLVAEAFIPIPEHLKDIPIEKLDVGHLKTLPNGLEDKTANEVWNLAWMSRKENMNYGTLSERRSEAHKGEKNGMYGKHHSEEARKKMSNILKGHKHSEESKQKMSNILTNRKDLSKSVLQIDKNTNEVIDEFPSTMEIQRKFKYLQGHISACCRGERKSAYGYKWEYKNG